MIARQLSVLVALAGLASVLSGARQPGDAASILQRLTLIPASPGGPPELRPSYALDSLPPATFEVVLGAELGSDLLEDYYLARAQLAAVNLRVLVFDADSYSPSWTGHSVRPLAVLGPDASAEFRLDMAGLQPGHSYAWVVVGEVQHEKRTSVLWSMPLYFDTLPQPSFLPLQTPAADQSALLAVSRLIAVQSRSQHAARLGLMGRPAYANFAAASDTFFCAPLGSEATAPWPESATPGWPLGALLEIGNLAGATLRIRSQERAGSEPELKAYIGLGQQARSLAAGLRGLPASPEIQTALTSLDVIGSRLLDATSDEARSGLLAELLICIDKLLGPGTRRLPAPGVQGFAEYAHATLRRLEGVLEYTPAFYSLLLSDQQQAWEDWIRQLRAELTLLAEDARRGRISTQQLQRELLRIRALRTPLYPEEWRFVDPDSGAVNLQRVELLKPDQIEQQRRLLRELYWFHLHRFGELLVPVTPVN